MRPSSHSVFYFCATLSLLLAASNVFAQDNTLVVAPGDNFVMGELPSVLDSIVVYGYCRVELLAEHRMRIGRIVVAPGGRLEIGTRSAPIRHVLRMVFTEATRPAIEVAKGGALSMVGWSGNLQLSSASGTPGTFLQLASGAAFCHLSGVNFSNFTGTASAPVVNWLATPGFIHGCTFEGTGDQLHVDAADGLTISRNEFKVTDGRALRLSASGLGQGNLIEENTFYVNFSARPRVQGKLEEQGRVAVLVQNPLQRFTGNFISTTNADVALAYVPPSTYANHTWQTEEVSFSCSGNTIKNVGHPAGTGTGFWFGAANLSGDWVAETNVISGFELGASVRPHNLMLRNWRLIGNSYGLVVGNAPLEDVYIMAGLKLPRAATAITFGREGESVRPRARNLYLSGYPVGMRIVGAPLEGNYLANVSIDEAEQPLVIAKEGGVPLAFPEGTDWGAAGIQVVNKPD